MRTAPSLVRFTAAALRAATLPAVMTAAAALAVSAGGATAARAQEKPAPTDRAARDGAVRKFRGVLRWRKAVWTLDAAGFADAAEDLERARTMLADGSSDFTVVYLLGLCRIAAGDAPKATAWLDAARRMAPDFPGHGYADVLRTSDETTRAGGATREQRDEMLKTLDATLASVETYKPDGAFAAELEFLVVVERGTQAFRNGANERAISDFERAAALARSQGREPPSSVLRSIALCHQNLKQAASARKVIEDAIRRDPGEASHYHVLGQLAADVQDFKASRGHYLRAVERRRDFAPSLEKLAYIAWDAADLRSMLANLDAAQFCYESGQAPSAVTPARMDANLRTARAMYWLRRADRAEESGDTPLSLAHCRSAKSELLAALKSEATCSRALTLLVRVHDRLGEADEAAEVARKVDELREKLVAVYIDTFC